MLKCDVLPLLSSFIFKVVSKEKNKKDKKVEETLGRIIIHTFIHY